MSTGTADNLVISFDVTVSVDDPDSDSDTVDASYWAVVDNYIAAAPQPPEEAAGEEPEPCV